MAADKKKGARRKAVIAFVDESGFMLQPVNRRTWAPRGETPIQHAWDRHDRLSVAAAITLTPQRRRLGLFFGILGRNINAEDAAMFVLALHRHVRRPIILVWDRSSVHRSAAKALQNRKWLKVEWLPAYAPDLNPVEAAWSHTKHSDLANYIPNDADELWDAVGNSLDDLNFTQPLLRSFFRWADLEL